MVAVKQECTVLSFAKNCSAETCNNKVLLKDLLPDDEFNDDDAISLPDETLRRTEEDGTDPNDYDETATEATPLKRKKN